MSACPSQAQAGLALGGSSGDAGKNVKRKRYLEAKRGLGLDQGYLGWLEAGPGEPRRLQKTQKKRPEVSKHKKRERKTFEP